ncbi:MAG: guanylate kinase [bacterium]|nr:guanylate kinase [bacterium]
MKKKQGKIVIISSPSGGGKTSICRKLLSASRKKKGWTFSVSTTTRARRKGERDGREYNFVDDKTFRDLIRKDYFAEHFKVHLYRYGTPRTALDSTIKKGGVLLLDVDTQGAFRLKKEYPEAITIFVLPPSVRALKQRLSARGTETREQLRVRFENALSEMRLYNRFEYVVVNDSLQTAVDQVIGIVEAHPCRTENLDRELIKRIVG